MRTRKYGGELCSWVRAAKEENREFNKLKSTMHKRANGYTYGAACKVYGKKRVIGWVRCDFEEGGYKDNGAWEE